MGRCVILFHIQPETNDIASSLSLLLQMLKDLSEHTLTTVFCGYIDTLNPPEPAVTPITPFVSVHHLGDGFASGIASQVIDAFVLVCEQRLYSWKQPGHIEVLVFAFYGQTIVKVSHYICIIGCRTSDLISHGCNASSG